MTVGQLRVRDVEAGRHDTQSKHVVPHREERLLRPLVLKPLPANHFIEDRHGLKEAGISRILRHDLEKCFPKGCRNHLRSAIQSVKSSLTLGIGSRDTSSARSVARPHHSFIGSRAPAKVRWYVSGTR